MNYDLLIICLGWGDIATVNLLTGLIASFTVLERGFNFLPLSKLILVRNYGLVASSNSSPSLFVSSIWASYANVGQSGST